MSPDDMEPEQPPTEPEDIEAEERNAETAVLAESLK